MKQTIKYFWQGTPEEQEGARMLQDEMMPQAFRDAMPDHPFDDSMEQFEIATRECMKWNQLIKDLEMMLSEGTRDAIGNLLDGLLDCMHQRLYKEPNTPEIWVLAPDILAINHAPYTHISLSSGRIGGEEDIRTGWDVIL